MVFRSLLLFVVAAAALPACSAQRAGLAVEPPAVVAPDRYAATFDAARRTLRDRGFILERVDAQAGIITTQPKTTAGLATPWDREQQSFSQEIEDALQRHQRVVRVVFTANASDALSPTQPDLRTGTEPLTMSVLVTLQRVNVPGRKLEPEAIGRDSYYWDPELAAREMQPAYTVAVRQDEALARRLADLILAAAERP